MRGLNLSRGSGQVLPQPAPRPRHLCGALQRALTARHQHTHRPLPLLHHPQPCRCRAAADGGFSADFPADAGIQPASRRPSLARRAQLALLDLFPPLGSPEVLRRAAVTGGILCLLRLGACIPLPGIDQAAVKRSAATLAILEGSAGVTPALPVSIFALGIGPMFVGGLFVTATRLVPQQLLPWARRSGEEGQMDDKLLEKGVAAAAALLVGTIRALQLRPHAIPGARAFLASSTLTLAAGAVVLHFLADTNEAAGLGIGAGLLVATSLLQRQAQLASLALARLRSGAAAPLPAAAAAAATVALIAAAIWVSLTERRLDMVSTKIGSAPARPAWARRRRAAAGSALPIRITPTGVSSLMLSSVYLSMLLDVLPLAFGAGGSYVAARLAGPAVAPLLVAGVSFLSVFVNPAGAKMTLDLSVMMQNIGAGIRSEPPVPPGGPTRRLLARQLRLANFWGGLAVAALGCAAYSLDLVCQAAVGITFGAVNMLLLTGYVTSTYRQVAALSELPKLGRRIEREQELLQSYAD